MNSLGRAITKSRTIAYWQFDETNGDLIADWCGGRYRDIPHPKVNGARFRSLLVPSAEELLVAGVGDVIIKDAQGNFYPCNPDIFEATYDKVEQ